MRRRIMLLVALLAVTALWIAPAAHADAPTWPKIVTAPGTIFDVDADRILFAQSNTQFAVMNRHTGAITPIPSTPHILVLFGRLTSHGAIFAIADHTSVYEWRDGQVIPRGGGDSVASLEVAGSHAAWSTRASEDGPPSVFHLDLDTGVVTTLTIDGRSEDVAANGDVVYESGDHSIKRWRAGVTTTLAAGSLSAWEADPRTDGTNVVWSEGPACECNGQHSIRGYGPTGPFTLANTTRQSPIKPDLDYRVAGGWIAFTRGEMFAQTVWVRDASPIPVETQVSDVGSHYVATLEPAGETVFSTDAGYSLAVPGAETIPIGVPSEPFFWATSHRDYLHHTGGRWEGAIGNSIERLSLTDAPTNGSETAIDSAPEGWVSSTSATFDFSSGAGTTFQTKLDDGDWQSTVSPSRSYTNLSQGTHTFLVRVVEPDLEVDTEPASQMWKVDTIAPVVTLVATGDRGPTSTRTPAFEGKSSFEANADEQVAVRIYAGTAATGTPFETVMTDRDRFGDWSTAASPPLPDGPYAAQASQGDAAGNTGSSEVRTFVVDATPPAAFALRSPADGAQNLPQSPELSWDATSDAGTGLTRYELWIDGQKDRELDPSICSGGVCAAHPASDFASGAHTWQVKAFDAVGNVRESETRDLTVDRDAPEPFGLTSPADGARIDDATPTLSWEAAADASLDHYEVWLDGTRVTDAVHGTEFTPDALGDGEHSWHVDAVDGAGHVRSSSSRSFTVDTTPPHAALDAQPNQVLTGDSVQFVATGSSDPMGGSIVRYEWDLDGDGDFERDTGADSTTSSTYATPRDFDAAVRVTDSLGHTSTDTSPVSVRLPPPPGPPGVSIENGAQFTNDADVTVKVVWPQFASDLTISNDGGFGDATTMGLSPSVPWRLDSSGPERLPKTIYVRFGDSAGTYQDDIILDETDPTLVSATERTMRDGSARIRVIARDPVSGLSKLQLATNREHPRKAIRFRHVVKLGSSHVRPLVRVRDGAGNWSHWKRARRG